MSTENKPLVLLNESQLEGRIIEEADFDVNDLCWIRFKDGALFCFHVEGGDQDYGLDRCVVRRIQELSDTDLLCLGEIESQEFHRREAARKSETRRQKFEEAKRIVADMGNEFGDGT